ncbi:MAG: long-chain fatty acid--CoA ligase [Actinobacteria bacterium]|nr:long-chain fatty acid--CoA ligase [Actinomycetota bacterium]
MSEDTICGRYKSCLKEYGGLPMMKHYREGAWREISWNEFDGMVQRLGSAMLSLGIEPGDRIAIYSGNCPEWQLTDIALLSIGAVNVALYQTLTAPQAEYILSDSGSRIVFVGGEEQLERILNCYDDLPGLFKIVTMDNRVCDHPDVITFDRMLELGAEKLDSRLLEERLEQCEADDLCSIIYTSGTTGNPKGVMLTHDNIMSNERATRTLGEVNAGDVTLSILPLSHSLERTVGYYLPIFHGVTIAHARSIEELINDFPVIKPNFMVSVPRMYEKVYTKVIANLEKEPAFKRRMFEWALKNGRKVSKLKTEKKPVPFFLGLKFKIARKLVFSKVYEKIGGRVRFFASGGAPLAREISEFFHAMDILILEGYGLTETAPILTVNRDTDYRFGSVGLPLENVEIRIAEDGEVLARGPNIMKGYYNNPEATAEVIDSEGWFHTGDIGHLDEDGFLYITDRKKDIIVTAGGKNIAPQNIENVLKVDRYIEQVCVIGDRRKFVSALVVPDFDELRVWACENSVDAEKNEDLAVNEKVIDFYRERIDALLEDFARFEKVKKFVLLPGEFTEEAGFITPSLKMKRKTVEEAFRKEIEGMYRENGDVQLRAGPVRVALK